MHIPWTHGTWTLGLATSLLLAGCVVDLTDDGLFGDDDNLEDDDAGDDDSDDDPEDPPPDDNTGDEGATASTPITFHLTDTFFSLLPSASGSVQAGAFLPTSIVAACGTRRRSPGRCSTSSGAGSRTPTKVLTNLPRSGRLESLKHPAASDA